MHPVEPQKEPGLVIRLDSTQGSHLPGKWSSSKKRSREEANLKPEISQGTQQWGDPPGSQHLHSTKEGVISHQHPRKARGEG